MSEWNALAEFYLQCQDFSGDIYCLCSRLFTVSNKNHDKHDATLKMEDDTEYLTLSTALKQSDIEEQVSCYYSSSHTDNISTDEHDSFNDLNLTNKNKAMYSSDSGADLREYSSNNDLIWQKYWALNGERIIWESWISKYSAYINVENTQKLEFNFNQESSHNDINNAESLQQFNDSKFSLNSSCYQKDNTVNTNLDISVNSVKLKENFSEKNVEKNRIINKNILGNDGKENDGWNPLSSSSYDNDLEAEHLINSRCTSRTGSSARTVDSMTNVTQLTVSSVDLSDDSKNTDSLSSVSSVQSSLTSTSSEDFEESTNYDSHWNRLWIDHYQEEYTKNYNKFMTHKTVDELSKSIDEVSNSAQDLMPKSSNAVDSDILYSESEELDEIAENDEDYDNYDDQNTIEQLQMKHMGLPTCFMSKKNNKTSNNKLLNFSSRNTPQLHLNRIKESFSLLGIEMQEGDKKELQGSVKFKMNNIHVQNRSLQICKNTRYVAKPNKIYFDENGDVVTKEDSNDFDNKLMEIYCDELPNSSTSTEDDLDKPFQKLDAIENDGSESINKKKKRKRKSNYPIEIKRNPKLIKYWQKRYSLFRRFDEGIKLDEESWFSVSPELIALHTAERAKCNIIIDAFCGAGGNTIQFALTCNRVIAIDIDNKKLELAKHNAEIYGVSHKIDFIHGNYFHLADHLKADVVFLSPPWGGPTYLSYLTYDLEMLQPKPFSELFATTKKITDNMIFFIPKNSNTHPMILAVGPEKCVEFEQNFLNKKLIAITAYMGNLVKEDHENKKI